MNKEELKEIRTTIAWLFGNGDFKNEEKALEKYKDSINKLNEAINYTRCCETLPSDIEVGKAMSELSDIADKEVER